MVEGIHIRHYLPGRLRLRVVALKHAPEYCERVERELAQVPGVRRVQVRSDTGSVLLEYDHAALRRRETLDRLRLAAGRLLCERDAARLEGYLDRLM